MLMGGRPGPVRPGRPATAPGSSSAEGSPANATGADVKGAERAKASSSPRSRASLAAATAAPGGCRGAAKVSAPIMNLQRCEVTTSSFQRRER